MTEDDINGLPLGEDTSPDAAELACAIGKVIQGRDTEAVLWALTIMVADVIRQASDDLGDTRHLFSGFCWNLHQSIDGLSAAVSPTGDPLDLTARGEGLPVDERAQVSAATPFLSNLFAGLLATMPANVVLSGSLSAILSMVCSLGDEAAVKRMATNLRQIAKVLPQTRVEIVEAREAAARDEAAFAGRATVGDVGRA